MRAKRRKPIPDINQRTKSGFFGHHYPAGKRGLVYQWLAPEMPTLMTSISRLSPDAANYLDSVPQQPRNSGYFRQFGDAGSPGQSHLVLTSAF
jgi:hypothetical protein